MKQRKDPPKKIHIMGREYAVTYVSKPMDIKDKPNIIVLGKINTMSKRIYIYDDGCPFHFWETLIHEVLHGLDHHAHINLTHDQIARTSAQLAVTFINSDILPKIKHKKASVTRKRRHTDEDEEKIIRDYA